MRNNKENEHFPGKLLLPREYYRAKPLSSFMWKSNSVEKIQDKCVFQTNQVWFIVQTVSAAAAPALSFI